MKIIEATPHLSGGKVIEVIAESRRGRVYQCHANRRGTITRTFRKEPSPDPRQELWVYVPVPPALRRAAREAVRRNV